MAGRADATMMVAVCANATCPGSPILVQDNAAGDTSSTLGEIALSLNAFGFDVTLTAHSKPAIGGASQPELDLTFSAVSTAPPGTALLALFVTDTDFVGTHPFRLSGSRASSDNNDGMTGFMRLSNNNTPLDFGIGSTQFAAIDLRPQSLGLPFDYYYQPRNPLVGLTLGVSIGRYAPGTSGATVRFSTDGPFTPVPEPTSMALLGTGIVGLALRGRKRT